MSGIMLVSVSVYVLRRTLSLSGNIRVLTRITKGAFKGAFIIYEEVGVGGSAISNFFVAHPTKALLIS